MDDILIIITAFIVSIATIYFGKHDHQIAIGLLVSWLLIGLINVVIMAIVVLGDFLIPQIGNTIIMTTLVATVINTITLSFIIEGKGEK